MGNGQSHFCAERQSEQMRARVNSSNERSRRVCVFAWTNEGTGKVGKRSGMRGERLRALRGAPSMRVIGSR